MQSRSARSCELVVIPDTQYVIFAKNAPDDIPGLIKFDTVPVVYKFQVQATAGQSFEAAFTVGPPPVGDPRLLRYARRISQPAPIDISWLVQEKVRFECRALIAAAAGGPITMEHVKQAIRGRVVPWLSQYGLMVYHFDFDAALKLPYFSHLFRPANQNILAVKKLTATDVNLRLSLPVEVFNHALGTFGATFKPGVGLTYAQGHLGLQDKFKFDFNVADDSGFTQQLTCGVRTTGHPKPEIFSDGWKRFVYEWNLKQGDFLIFYEISADLFTGVKYKIGVVRMARSPYRP